MESVFHADRGDTNTATALAERAADTAYRTDQPIVRARTAGILMKLTMTARPRHRRRQRQPRRPSRSWPSAPQARGRPALAEERAHHRSGLANHAPIQAGSAPISGRRSCANAFRECRRAADQAIARSAARLGLTFSSDEGQPPAPWLQLAVPPPPSTDRMYPLRRHRTGGRIPGLRTTGQSRCPREEGRR